MSAEDVAGSPPEAADRAAPGLFRPRAIQRDFAAGGGSVRRVGWDGLALAIYFIALLTLELQFLSGGDVGFNPSNLIMVGGAIVAAAMIVGTRQQGRTLGIGVAPQDYALVLLLGCCTFSSVISVDPVATLTQTFYIVAMWLAAICLGRVPAEVGARLIVRASVVIAVLSFLVIVVAPSLAFQPASSTGLPELRGIFKHQLRLGLFMSISVAFMVIAWRNGQARFVIHQKTWIAWVMFLVVFVCMVLSLARSNVAFMLISLPISLGLSRRGWIRWATLAGVIVFATLIVTYADVLMSVVADDNGQVSLSGRTLIWQRTLAAAGEAPWLGHGYAVFDNYIFNYLWPGVYRPPHAHNSFINAYFEIGLVGVALLVLFILVQLISVIRQPPVRRHSYALFLVVLSFFSSLMGVTYAGKPSVLLGLLLIFVAMETSRARVR